MPSITKTRLPTDSEIHARIVNAVLDQRLLPGTRLTEQRLGQVFGVSRTRIRQVLIRLATERLVTLAPNCGARVCQPSAEDAIEVFAVRRMVEPTLVSAFVTKATAAQINALERWITLEESQRTAAQWGSAIRTAGAFHLHIAAHAGNATLERLLHELVVRTALVLMMYGPRELGEPPMRRGHALRCECREHRALLDAIRLRDPAAAGREMVKHLDRLRAQLVFNVPEVSEPDLEQVLAAV